MEFLSLQEIIARREEIARAFDRLMTHRVLVARTKAYQWQFFRGAFEALFSTAVTSPMQCISAVRAAQFKFEVEDKLRRYYLRSGREIDFVFTLVHRSRLTDSKIGAVDLYPSLAGYSVLIRDLTSDSNPVTLGANRDEKLYVERVVSESIDAEFRAYGKLPEVIADDLRKWFIEGGPAFKEIMNILVRHQKRGWTISNPLNPSTKRLLNIKVRKLGSAESVVNTMEYWYLRWWDEKENSYVYPYRETNRQTYILRKDADGWKVYENLRPLPRTSIAFKGWHRKQIKRR